LLMWQRLHCSTRKSERETERERQRDRDREKHVNMAEFSNSL